MANEISESELLAQYKAGHEGLSYKVAWLENQLDWVQKILAEIDKKCGSGFLPREIEDAYVEYQRLIDVGPDNVGGQRYAASAAKRQPAAACPCGPKS